MVVGIIAIASTALLVVTATTAVLALVRHLFRVGPSRARLNWRPRLAPTARIWSNRAPTWSSRDVEQAIDSAIATMVIEDELALGADAIDVLSDELDAVPIVVNDEVALDVEDTPRLDAVVQDTLFDFSEPTVAEDVYNSAEQIAAMLAKEVPPQPPKRIARGSLSPIPRMQTIRGVQEPITAKFPKSRRPISAFTPS